MKAIGIRLVKLIVAQTNHSAYIIIFTKVYYCPNFFTDIISLNILQGKGIFFNSLYNTINFIKDQAEIAYTPYINGLNMFILVDNPTEVPFTIALATAQSCLYKKGMLAKATIETQYKRLQHLLPDQIYLFTKSIKGIIVTKDKPFYCKDCYLKKAKK